MSKGIIRISTMKYPLIPKFKTRSEKEMEELLHRHKVMKRRREVAEIIDQNPAIMTTEILKYRVEQGINYLKSKVL